MKVKFTTFFGQQTMPLERALMPDFERDALQANKETQEMICRLLAHLVESEQMPIETAFQIAGVYVQDLEIVND